MFIKLFLTSILILLFFLKPAFADLDKAKDAIEKKDYNTAYKELVVPANKGDAQAQAFLGILFLNGEGVQKDEEKAEYWFREASEQGLSGAQVFLSEMLTTENPEESFYWATQAAQAGNAEGQYRIGIMYQRGLGTEQNGEEAFYWFEQAALNNHAQAQFQLSLKLFLKDKDASFKWALKAAEQGFFETYFQIGMRYEYGLGTSISYREAYKWYRKAADEGHIRAQYSLGRMFSGDENPSPNYKEAKVWFERAAENGEIDAYYELGDLFYEGLGVPQDFQKAFQYFSYAAERGNAMSQSQLGVMYAGGQGVKMDWVKAHMWFNIAGTDELLGMYFRENRDDLAKIMSPSEIQRAQEMAAEWLEKQRD